MTKVGIENSYNYLVNLGVSTKAINADGVGLALGTSGITVIEMQALTAALPTAECIWSRSPSAAW